MSAAEDLKALDGPALAARLAMVKARALEDHDDLNMDGVCVKGRDLEAARADTAAVLDECAARLLGAGVGTLSHGLAAFNAQGDELLRLRGLIRAVMVSDGLDCACDANTLGAVEHARDCPWPALVAEAGKP